MIMMTVHEVSKLTGVSIRALQYYDKIGLLKPTGYTQSGYRLYDDTALETLQQILLFRELEFPLKEIKTIISSADFDREKALEQQITLLTMKKEHLKNLISLTREIQYKGERTMDFSAFDTSKIEEYARRAKEQWGNTAEYKESEEKASKKLTEGDLKRLRSGKLALKDGVSFYRDFKTANKNKKVVHFETGNYNIITMNSYFDKVRSLKYFLQERSDED